MDLDRSLGADVVVDYAKGIRNALLVLDGIAR
jgi:hypothetical protein